LNRAELIPVRKAMTGIEHDDSPLYTPAEAADILKIRESWLRTKAAARAIPCTFLGKHLRFSDEDIAQIKAAGARKPVSHRRGTHQ
jgi:excisionase family DNA binding protein